MSDVIHFPSTSDFFDRLRRTENIIRQLDVSSVADIGGADYYNLCKSNNIEYVSLNIEEPQKTGQGGYHRAEYTVTYDGKNIPLDKNSYELVIVNFVLHHAPDETLNLIEQIRDISKRYVIVGEDISGLDHEIEWHVRNFHHQPGGLFRSDKEWKSLFSLYGMSLVNQYVIHRDDDPDPNKIYRCMYLLEINE
jgi:SAM-dependent methyltransferase